MQNLDAVFGKAESTALLDLEIKRVTLTDHPLFIEEDQLTCELEGLSRKYQRRAEIDWVEFYTQKLIALQSALETVQREREIAKDEVCVRARARAWSCGCVCVWLVFLLPGCM